PRIRHRLELRRRLCWAPAPKGRGAVRAALAGDGARRGLPASRGRRAVSRLPVRLRVTAAFAVAMATVLAASGWFLYARLDSHLAVALDRELEFRSQDLAALVRQPAGTLAGDSGGRLIERGESFAQLIDPARGVVDAAARQQAAPRRDRASCSCTSAALRGSSERPGPRRALAPAGDAGLARRPAADLGGRRDAARQRGDARRLPRRALDRRPGRASA